MGAKNTQFNTRGPFLGDYVSGKYVGYHAEQLADATPGIPTPDPSGHTATGGIISDYTTAPGDVYRAHIFTASGTFDVTAVSSDYGDTIEYLVVGGGGGGGYTASYYTCGGGGGAGGLRTNVSGNPLDGGSFSVTVQPYTVTIGAGGKGSGASSAGFNGGNSEFHAPPLTYPGAEFIRGAGGGGGASAASPAPAVQDGNAGGGSGGGLSGYTSPKTGGSVGTADPNHPETAGYPGGDGPPSTSWTSIGSGGGGAGAAGEQGRTPGAPSTGPNGGNSGTGGLGHQVLIGGPGALGTPGPDPANGYFAGGGGGGILIGPGDIVYAPPTVPLGGGGGSGYMGPGDGAGHPGTAATGGGGGGGSTTSPPWAPYGPGQRSGGNGGSGIVVVRYQIGSVETAKATGGAISFYNDKTIHVFTGSGTFETTANWTSATVEYVVVGGGGAGGTYRYRGGGGGAGAMRVGSTPIGAHPVSTVITVGGGGHAAYEIISPSTLGNGSASLFGPTLPAAGGGMGGTFPAEPGIAGGSGGGAGGNPTSNPGVGSGDTFPGTIGDSPSNGWGNDGGSATGLSIGAGGGGASAVGHPNNPDSGNPTQGIGGAGLQLPASFRDPESRVGAAGPTSPTITGADTSGLYWVAGGGNGGGYGSEGNPLAASTRSAGGGGLGGNVDTPNYAGGEPALENTGSGGGGASATDSGNAGGSGGSGIVLIAYPT